jgi:hypothetical protein
LYNMHEAPRQITAVIAKLYQEIFIGTEAENRAARSERTGQHSVLSHTGSEATHDAGHVQRAAQTQAAPPRAASASALQGGTLHAAQKRSYRAWHAAGRRAVGGRMQAACDVRWGRMTSPLPLLLHFPDRPDTHLLPAAKPPGAA